ncbi:MAG TPA: hypothetical protein VFJ98_01910 [Mycobacteriales bacterium]|nr:hypothetical protein [Mycobacteriales bacterium]
MRRVRLLLAIAAIGTAVAGGLGSSVDAAKPVPSCSLSVAGRGWFASRPHFPAGQSQHVTKMVAVTYAPGLIFATNGATVMRTQDLGCTWKPLVIPVPPSESILPVDVPQPLDGLLRIPATFTITDLSAPSSATQASALYVSGTNSTVLGEQPEVYALDTDGTLLERSSGLPNRGTLDEVTASSSVPNIAYAVVGGNDPTGAPGLYVTTDSGRDWTRKPAAVTGLSSFEADPVVPTSIFALGGNGIDVSHDAGQSDFVSAGRRAGDVTSYDVVSGGGGARIVQGHADAARIDRSDDGGTSWISEPTPVAAEQVALQPLLDNVAVSDGHHLYLQNGGKARKAQDITPPAGAATQVQFSAPSPTGYLLFAVVDDTVAVRGFALDGVTLTAQQLQKVVLTRHGPPRQFPATLTPGSTALTLRPGEHRDVPFTLLLPRTPSPVDVMFLVDTTASMQPTINGLRQDLAIIVNDVASTGLDARFGVAEFRDYAPGVRDMGAGEIGDKPYTLRRVVGLDDAGLEQALNKLKAAGGGDPPEADLTALLQSTTGQGQTAAGKVVVPPGEGADYRTGSLRLAVLATDEPFHRERHYLTPQWAQVVAALRAHNVYPIGLAVQSSNDSPTPQFDGLHDEQAIAAATGSVAPTGGVDCNGDLVPDIPAGQPFACKVPVQKTSTAVAGVKLNEKTLPVKLAPAIVNAAENLPDLRTVSLGFSGNATIARLVSPAPLPVLNLRNDNRVGYTVRFTCPRSKHRRVYRLGVSATDGTRSLVSSSATVTCAALVPLPHTKLPIPPAAVAVIPPAAAGAAPPAPGNPVPNANPNPNPVPNANVGFASQQEEQRQLAFADADAGVEWDDATEMQMSRLGGDDTDPAPWLFGAAGVLLTAATAYAARSRFSAAWHTSGR